MITFTKHSCLIASYSYLIDLKIFSMSFCMGTVKGPVLSMVKGPNKTANPILTDRFSFRKRAWTSFKE